jgi:AcrR family transcriptional regulator
MNGPMNKKVERGRATRDQLIAIATELFAAQGYEDTSIEAVLQESGVSRGALYHHFKGKDALFEAVLRSIEVIVTGKLVAATEGAPDAVSGLRAGGLAWIELATDPVVQRIALIDAPSVLGWERWREIENEHGLGLLKVALAGVANEGGIPAEMITPFAHMLLAAMNETAIMIARSDDPATAMARGLTATSELVDRLLRSP